MMAKADLEAVLVLCAAATAAREEHSLLDGDSCCRLPGSSKPLAGCVVSQEALNEVYATP
jgi:hypothetical protein